MPDLDVAAAGEYEFELCRWPAEADLPLTASLEETRVTDGVYVPGKAMPIGSARIRLGGQERSAEASEGSQGVSFRVTLAEGPTTLQTWFCDGEGKGICGAYYVYVRRLGGGDWRLQGPGSRV